MRLISLQKGFGAEQVATADFPVVDLSGKLDEEAGPFVDTAAVIRNLDLVVTSDTAIAHLAGALGCAGLGGAAILARLALVAGPRRYALVPDDAAVSPKKIGEWPDVFERITRALAAQRSEID